MLTCAIGCLLSWVSEVIPTLRLVTGDLDTTDASVCAPTKFTLECLAHYDRISQGLAEYCDWIWLKIHAHGGRW